MLRLDIPITKVDAARRLVYGIATAEVADRAGEICDYASTKPFYERWSEAISTSTDGRSLGNLRAMHGTLAAGKVTALHFNDDARQIEICAKVVDDGEWAKVAEGVYTGFSQGGSYIKRWTDEAGATRYTADPSEISLVDLPCLAEARFELIKVDGSREFRPFINPTLEQAVGKAGARNSAADLDRLQTVHDTAVALGAACPARKAAGAVSYGVCADEAGVAAMKHLLDTRLDRFRADLGKSLDTAVADLAERLRRIEDQPQPLPYAPTVRPVGKDDRAGGGLSDDALADPALLSLLAIKLAQRQSR